jgi:hypothetical protein
MRADVTVCRCVVRVIVLDEIQSTFNRRVTMVGSW